MLNWIKSHKLLTGLVILALIFGGYQYNQSQKVSYDEFTVTRGDIKETLELSGKVTASTMATLRFPAGGLVTYLGAKEGDSVKKWATLASIDTRQLQKTLEQKLNLYKSALNTFDDTKDGYENQIEANDIDNTLRRILERNQYTLENSVKDVEYLDLSLKLSRLTSPIAGILVRAPIDTANVQVLATDTWVVVDPSSLYLSADLDETDLKRASVGQKVLVTLDAYPDETIESVISSISYSPKETTSGTTYEVKVALPSEFVRKLRLGLNGTAAIILTEKNDTLLLPSSALTVVNGKSSVFVNNNEKYEEVQLESGTENEGMVEITSGVTEGQRVYIKK